jgi:hypothetical protein
LLPQDHVSSELVDILERLNAKKVLHESLPDLDANLNLNQDRGRDFLAFNNVLIYSSFKPDFDRCTDQGDHDGAGSELAHVGVDDHGFGVVIGQLLNARQKFV